MRELTPEGYEQAGWRPASGFGFARRLALQPLAVDEVGRVADGMPVAFRQHAGCWQAVAVMGPVADLNLYVAADGRWRASFVPAALRVYPFCLAADQQTLALWPDYAPESSGQPGVKPFFVDGALSPELQRVQAFLLAVEKGIALADAPLRLLDERGLLRPWAPHPETAADAAAETLAGLYCVDAAGLQRLPDADWLSLRRDDALRWLHAHLDSLYHRRRFTALADGLRQSAATGAMASRIPPELDDFFAAMGEDLQGLDR